MSQASRTIVTTGAHAADIFSILVVNSSLTTRSASRPDIRIIEALANAIAEELGSQRLANLVLLGALLAAVDVLPLEAIDRALAAHLPERHRSFLAANRQALRRGAAIAEGMPVQG